MRADLQNRVPRPQELILHDIRISMAQVALYLFPLVAYDHINIFLGDKACDQIDDIINDQPLAKRFKDFEEGCAIPFSRPGSQEDGF